MRRIAADVERGVVAPAAINEELITRYSWLPEGLEPDLFIRTGGEQRLSNYLLWHLAYTELYFTQTLWPDFGAPELDSAIQQYSNRQRRFGRTGEQVATGAVSQP
jgi:undecaprenyl diphosphate synthase